MQSSSLIMFLSQAQDVHRNAPSVPEQANPVPRMQDCLHRAIQFLKLWGDLAVVNHALIT